MTSNLDERRARAIAEIEQRTGIDEAMIRRLVHAFCRLARLDRTQSDGLALPARPVLSIHVLVLRMPYHGGAA